MDDAIRYAFIIMAILIVVTYFVGAATDTNALASGLQKLVYALIGKSPTGATSAYPSGATYSAPAA